MKKQVTVERSNLTQAEVAAAQMILAKAGKERQAEVALEEEQAAVVAEEVVEQVQEQAAADTGHASEQDIAYVLGDAAGSVTGLSASPLTYVGGVLGSSLAGGGSAAAFVPQVGVGSAAAGAASVASVEEDVLVSVGSVEGDAEEAEDTAAQEESAETVVFEVVAQAPEQDANVSFGQIATVDNNASSASQAVAPRARLKVDGVEDNNSDMRISYGEGASLSDTTPVLTGVAEANRRLVIRDKISGDTLGLTTTDANGAWSFQLPELRTGKNEVSVQTISMDREEVSFSFNVTETSQALVKAASNTSVAFEGTEDTARLFTTADLTALGRSVSFRAVQEVIIKALPADGVLQFRADDGTWGSVVVDQRVTSDQIANGRLRFVPDANESGASEYKSAGVGNLKDVYAEIEFELVAASAASDSAAVTVQMEINPVVDNVLSASHSPTYMGRVAGIDNGAKVWHRWVFNFSGVATDTDGSEINAVAVKSWNGWGTPNQAQEFAVLQNGAYTKLQPDANGVVWVKPGQTLFVSEYTTASHPLPFTTINYQPYRQEVNAAGDVIAQKAGTAVNTYLCPPSPLVLDLDGNGVQTSTLENGVDFDLNDDGKAGLVSWTDGIDGFLVLDRNGDGLITSGAEMFGDHTVMSNGEVARDGFAALADLDSNSDGVFDAQDSLFDSVQVWVDANRNGISEAGELFGLKELNVASIDLGAQATDRTENGNFYGLTSSFSRTDGSTAEIVDVWLTSSAEENHRYLSAVVI